MKTFFIKTTSFFLVMLWCATTNADSDKKAIESFLAEKKESKQACDSDELCKAANKYKINKNYEAMKGKFIGELILKPLDDGRLMQLVEDFGFIDSNSIKWQAPKGFITDGASIPQATWSFTGGPFEGKYRKAAVIHDFYCDKKTRKWQNTHDNFYEVMIASGVEKLKARVLYYAVYRFGPRWGCPSGQACLVGEVYSHKFDQTEYDKVSDLIMNNQIDENDIPDLIQKVDDTLWNANIHDH